jgi:hypothetical protein
VQISGLRKLKLTICASAQDCAGFCSAVGSIDVQLPPVSPRKKASSCPAGAAWLRRPHDRDPLFLDCNFNEATLGAMHFGWSLRPGLPPFWQNNFDFHE